MSITQFHTRFEGGKQWKVNSEGIYVQNEGLIRSSGQPKTVQLLWQDFHREILHVAWELRCPVDMIVAMIPIEAARIKGSLHMDPTSNRFEPGYISDAKTPHRRSTGLMQTLLSTAVSMNRIYGLQLEVSSKSLENPFVSLALGAAYIVHQIKRYGYDPVLICGAYNAGSVRKTNSNHWKIVSYGETRMDRYIQWYNDFHFARRSKLIEVPSWAPLTYPMHTGEFYHG